MSDSNLDPELAASHGRLHVGGSTNDPAMPHTGAQDRTGRSLASERVGASPGERLASLGERLALLGERLEEVARARGDAVAVVDGERRMSYRELLGRADALARELQARGIGPRDLVGVALPRSADLVVAVVGIVRSGAAYVPIDLSHPAERRARILSDAHPRLVVTEGSGIDGVPPGTEVLPLPQEAREWKGPRPRPSAEDPAYVIYTSGSTGQPNGVCVTQRNAARLFTVSEPVFGFGADDVWTFFHSIAFDFSVWELWGALLYGGRLVVVPAATTRAADLFHALVLHEGVTVLNQTPSAFRAFDVADAAAGRPENRLRHVVFGGEALDPRTLKGWFESHGDEQPRLVNMYGITETTVHVTFRRMRPKDARGSGKSLIGSPLADLRIDLLGSDRRSVADGEVGEIWVGGEGVSAGYIGRPELTAERFHPDPHGDGPSARMYRSGDLGRRLPDGDLEYLGRTDLQVKLRGFRIELGEIEAALREAPDVRDAVVALREQGATEPRLIAYVVMDRRTALDASALREHLVCRLPEYMVPSAYVRIDRVPRTVNDKVDRAALPVPTAADLPRGSEGEAPRDEVERRVAQIFSDVLDTLVTTRESDFFRLGGHSLLAVRMAILCQERLGVDLSANVVFGHPTVAALADRVRYEKEHPGTLRSVYPAGVVEVREGASDHPLFCLLGLGAIAFQFRNLATKMRTPRPILAIELHDMDIASSVLESLPDTAEAVVRCMRQVQPVGPYAVVGYSYGGNLAVEVARRLISENHAVELVAVLDAHPPGALRSPRHLRKLARHLRIVMRLKRHEMYEYISSRLWRRLRPQSQGLPDAGPAPAAPESEIERRVAETSERCNRAFHAYQPGPFPGRIVLVHATDLEDWMEVADPTGTCGWGTICTEGVNIIPIGCRHLDLFKEPHLTDLARHLDDLLEAINNA